MNEKLLERRLETVNLLSKGHSLSVLVKDLSKKYECSRQAIYHDVKVRSRWLPTVLNVKNRDAVMLDLIGAHKELVKEAWVEHRKGDNSSARVGALRLIRDLNRDLLDMTLAPDIMDKLNRLEEAAKRQTKQY